MTALATRSRPSAWDEVKGHQKTVDAVKALLSRDPAKVPHVFVFDGPPGTGKTTIARLIAQELVPDPEDRRLCIMEIDAATYSGADDIRSLKDSVRSRPMSGAPLVVIMDEVHRLSATSKDVLLKILEESGEGTLSHLYWILCTSEGDKLPTALIRRAQRYTLQPVSDRETKALLAKTCRAEGYGVPGTVLDKIIRAAEGSPGLALALLESVSPNCTADMSPEEAEAVANGIKGPSEAIGDLSKALIAGATREQVRGLLQGLKASGAQAESVRRGVLGYCAAAYLGTWYKGNPGTLLGIMEIFCAGNTFDSDWAGLIVLAVNAAGRE